MRAWLLAPVIALAMLWAPRVHAQPADVPGLIKLIENQPSDMDRSTWKEKRRDAARKLGQSKDKRATPVLTRLAETETFDIIGDIAIEGLGYLNDQSAVPTLQKVLADTSRDKSSRDLAKKSLAKLGAPEKPAGGTTGGTTTGGTTTGGTTGGTTTGGTTTGGGKTGGTTGGTTTGGTTTGGTTGGTTTGGTTGGATGGGKTGGTTGGTTGTTGGTTTGGTTTGGTTTTGGSGSTTGNVSVASGLEGGGETGGTSGTGDLTAGQANDTTIEGMPTLEDDVIAASERLTFAAGSANLQFQTTPNDNNGNRNKHINFDTDVASNYQRRLDTESKAFAIDGDAKLVGAFNKQEGRGSSKGLLFNLGINGEARFYSNKIYGVGKAAGALAIQYINYRDPNDNSGGNDIKDTTTQADLQVAIGGGFGRIVDIGSQIRVRRLSRILDDSRALGKPIDAATSKKLQLTWWALRKERSQFRSLIATVAILREAGILLGEPNAVITYEILTVLNDTSLFLRPSGMDVQVVVGEGYLKRPTDDMGNCLVTCGRIEQVIATAGYAQQVDEDKLELSGDAYARYRLLAPDDGTPKPWAIGAGAGMRRFTYGPHGDMFGVFDLRGELALSSNGSVDPNNPSDKAMRIMGELGFTYVLNQASGVRLAAEVAEDQGTIYLGASLQATYGLLDGTFAR